MSRREVPRTRVVRSYVYAVWLREKRSVTTVLFVGRVDTERPVQTTEAGRRVESKPERPNESK